MPSAVKPCRGPGLAQRRDVAGGPVAEAEVGADDDGRGVQRVDEHPLDELLRRPGRRPRGRRAAPARASAPASREQLGAVARSMVSVVGACSGRSTAIGCGSKVTATTGSAALVGDLAGPGEHLAVPEVDAVEVADHHDGAAEVGRDVGERAPDLHGAKTTRRAQHEDRDGPGPARRAARRARGTPRRVRTRAVSPARSRSRARPTRTSAACVVVEVDATGTPRARRRRSAARRTRSASWSRVRATVEVERADGGAPQRGQVAADPSRAPRSRAMART